MKSQVMFSMLLPQAWGLDLTLKVQKSGLSCANISKLGKMESMTIPFG